MATKALALVAHDNMKRDLVTWVTENHEMLSGLEIFATGTTGKLLEEFLPVAVTCLLSGPLGGDQQIGAKIAGGEIDMLIFFWDPLEPMPHDPDIKALLRIAALWNVPVACNRSTADFMIRSSLLHDESYTRVLPDFTDYASRSV
jgi:methylglyoxal synthase